MAATLSSLWGRAQSNKRPLPGQAAGCVDLTAEEETGSSQLSAKANSPDKSKITLPTSHSTERTQQHNGSVQLSKRRRLDKDVAEAQVEHFPNCDCCKKLLAKLTHLHEMLCRLKTASLMTQSHNPGLPSNSLPASNRLQLCHWVNQSPFL